MGSQNMFTRRDFLKVGSIIGSGLAIGFYFPFGNKLIGAQEKSFRPNIFINILPDDKIIISVTKAEMGQGVWTSLPMLIAEEMEADWSKIEVIQSPDSSFIGTGGSSSISRYGWKKMREAGAIAKHMLIEAASMKWKVSPVECEAKSGMIYHRPSRKKVSYGSVTDLASTLKIPKKINLKNIKNYSIIGKDMLRTDSVIKTNGTAPYAMDINLKGMVYAMVERPSSFGATYLSSNAEQIKKQPGILDVFVIPRGLAVIGKNTWSVIQAKKLLKIKWKKKKPKNNDSKIYNEVMQKLILKKADSVRKDGNPNKIAKKTDNLFEAQYHLPFQTHAAMEPCNCVVNVNDNLCEIWAGTQNPKNAVDRASTITGFDKKDIKINVPFLGGGFGRKSFNDFIDEGVYISQKIKKPTKLIWMREDDTRHGFNRPSSIHQLVGNIKNNKIDLWKHKIVSPDVAGQQMIYQYGASLPGLAKGIMSLNFVKRKISFIAEGAKTIKYNFPNMLIETKPFETDIPLGFWRAVYDSQNSFANESFIDELANLGNIDPVELRLKHLNLNSRSAVVIKKAAMESRWGKKLKEGRFHGFAYHYSFGSHVAEVAEISILKSKKVRVHNVTCVIDCGQTVNPMTIRAQMQSAIVFGIGATLKSEITVNKGKIDQGNYDDYKVLRMHEMPKIKVHIINNNEYPGGVGEPGLPPIAPAIANAVYAATGKRIRKLPITPTDLRS
tara:strand:+ start:13808 stop:15976 length:2169 start_codon:yes stop_codon:yes gene_type:complete